MRLRQGKTGLDWTERGTARLAVTDDRTAADGRRQAAGGQRHRVVVLGGRCPESKCPDDVGRAERGPSVQESSAATACRDGDRGRRPWWVVCAVEPALCRWRMESRASRHRRMGLFDLFDHGPKRRPLLKIVTHTTQPVPPWPPPPTHSTRTPHHHRPPQTSCPPAIHPPIAPVLVFCRFKQFASTPVTQHADTHRQSPVPCCVVLPSSRLDCP
jgi:hypothetical protein